MVAIFYSYAIYAYVIGADSLSDGWNKAKGNLKYLFLVSTFSYAILAIIIGLRYNEVAALISGVPLMYVIGSPNYVEGGLKAKVHYVGAIISVLGAFYFFVIMAFWWLILAVLFMYCVSWIFEKDKSRIIFWLELWVMSGVVYMYFELRV
jgi:hypothetical protein